MSSELDARKPFDGIRIVLHEIDQDCGLRIRPRATLLPVFERARTRM
jgi:hypothetical protein